MFVYGTFSIGYVELDLRWVVNDRLVLLAFIEG